MPTKILVCQNKTCHQQGSANVLTEFLASTPSGITVESSGCLGQCGSGPMVFILPEEIWYSCVHPYDVAVIAEQHLRRGRVVTQKLYPMFHSPRRPIGIWLTALSFLLSLLFLLIWMQATHAALLARG